MTLRTKLSLVTLAEVVATISIVGFFALQHSREEIESLARELLRARTDYAFTLCEMYNATNGEPTEELRERIKAVHIFAEGYITVISKAPGDHGKVLVHPTSEGDELLDRAEFPHVKQFFDDIDAAGRPNGYDKFRIYRQGTPAHGRQGERKLGYYRYFKPWDWVLLTSSYEADVYSSSNAVRKHVIEIILVIGFISLIIINLAVHRMLSPLRKLIDMTKEVAAGNLDASIQIQSADEISGLAVHFNDMLASLKQNTRVWQELSIARRLQSEMLPQGRPEIRGLEIEALSLPATEVGGDFYDFIFLDENRLAIVIGDVSGKGISGAMVMSSAMSALRFAADECSHTNEILELANRRLVRDIQRHMFVAVFLAIYDRREKALLYTNAGQTMPIIYRNKNADFLKQSDADRFPLGIRAEVQYAQQKIKFKPGDMLVCYTDGIVELFDKNRENYGFDRFRDSIIRHADKPIQKMLPSLLDDADAYVDAVPYSDDVTVVVIKFT